MNIFKYIQIWSRSVYNTKIHTVVLSRLSLVVWAIFIFFFTLFYIFQMFYDAYAF